MVCFGFECFNLSSDNSFNSIFDSLFSLYCQVHQDGVRWEHGTAVHHAFLYRDQGDGHGECYSGLTDLHDFADFLDFWYLPINIKQNTKESKYMFQWLVASNPLLMILAVAKIWNIRAHKLEVAVKTWLRAISSRFPDTVNPMGENSHYFRWCNNFLKTTFIPDY